MVGVAKLVSYVCGHRLTLPCPPEPAPCVPLTTVVSQQYNPKHVTLMPYAIAYKLLADAYVADEC